MKTKERIIHVSLDLFNIFGEPNVTTLQIADELDISPGNLYYHYKNKTEILSELFQRYESEMVALLEAPLMHAHEDVLMSATANSDTIPATPVNEIHVEDYWLFLHLVFESIAKYRFLYIDLVNILQRYEKIRGKFKKILHKKEEASFTICRALRDRKVLVASDTELKTLSQNIILTATYWPSFDIIHQPGDSRDVDLAKGVHQVISLVAPYLLQDEREQLLAVSQQYLD